ncbi:MAG: hypothetical protein ACK4NC_00770 [Candidatus Gracilibacteria bacterium]
MNKKIIIPLLLILVVALLGVSVSGFFLKSGDALSVSENAALLLRKTKVEKVEGTVEVLHNGSSKEVSENLEISEGDSVKVAEGGKAVIYWQDGSLSRIKGPAEIAVTQMNINQNLDTHVDMTVQSGEVWTKVLDMVTEDSSFTSRTKTTVASIRGTELFQKSSDGEEIIATYEHGVDLEINGEKKMVMDGEEFRLEHGKESLQTRASDPASWISDAKKADKEYMESLSVERIAAMKKLMDKRTASFPSDEELNALLDFSTGELKEKNEKVQNIIDTLSLQIRIAYASGDKDGAKKKADQLGMLLDSYIPSLEMSEQRDALVSDALNRMNVQQKILFADQTPDELIALRAKLGLAKLTLLGDNPEKSAILMQRQLFFVQDMVKNGKADEARQFFIKLSEFDRINEPVWNTMSDSRKAMMQKTSEHLVNQMPELKDAAAEFQKRVLSGESRNTNANTALSTTEQIRVLMSEGKITEAEKLFATLTLIEKTNVSKEFPVLGGVTPAEKTNANINAVVRDEKKTTTTSTTQKTQAASSTTTSTTTSTNTSAPTTTTQPSSTTQTNSTANTTTTIEKPAPIPAPVRTVNKNANTATTIAPTPVKGVYTPAN